VKNMHMNRELAGTLLEFVKIV